MASSDKLSVEKSDKYTEAVHIEMTSDTETSYDSIEWTDTGRVTWLISATVSLGGFLFGTSLSFYLLSQKLLANERSRI
jgi:hypothetical protein